jgi:membrane-bound ClpP family serine protease
VWAVAAAVAVEGEDPAAPAEANAVPAGSAVAAALVSVPLPLTGTADAQLMASLDRLLADLPPSDARPIVVLEFQREESVGDHTGDFERALAVARYLASDRFRRVRTVAYIPSTLTGHAVLPVLACEEIIIAPEAQLGAAGRGEPAVDPTILAAYREIAERRRTIPVALVLAMLDPALTVVEVQLVGGGTRYVLPEELAQLRAEAKIWKEEQVVAPGDWALLTGRDLRLKFGFASHLAAQHSELADALQVPVAALRDAVAAGTAWRAARVDIRGTITSRSADDVTRSVRDMQAGESANLVAVVVDSPGGSPAPALRLVNLFASLDGRTLRSVAYVESSARSVAALVALACDETYAAEDAILGGPGDTALDAATLGDLRAALQEVARGRQRDWSLLVALVDPQLEVYRYRQEGTGIARYLCEAEWQQLPDPGAWKREALLDLRGGISGRQAEEYGVLRGTAESFDVVMRRFNLQDPIAVARRNPLVSAIEQLGSEPWLARVLLFVAFFALISEASTPGLGVAGFISGLSFLLFFWSQFLNGTVGWLELMLFSGGLACLALELLVLPGFGIFGVGGAVMVLASIVLASQTFIFPRNDYQFEQLSRSMLTMVVACAGIVSALWMMRRYLAESWLIRRVMLPSPAEDLDLDLDQLESLVDWEHLEGQEGVTTTQLTPSGKARIGDDVVSVLSDGVLIRAGARVRVVQVRGNRVLVEPLEEV